MYGTAVAVHARDASKFQHQVGGVVGGVELLLVTVVVVPGAPAACFCCAQTDAPPPESESQRKPSFIPCPALQGYGTLLMLEAERIARCEHRSTKLAVISGVGTRHYYRKLG